MKLKLLNKIFCLIFCLFCQSIFAKEVIYIDDKTSSTFFGNKNTVKILEDKNGILTPTQAYKQLNNF